jgi:hypothetical protein
VSSRALEGPSMDKPKWTDRDGRVKTGVKRSAKAVRVSLKGDPGVSWCRQQESNPRPTDYKSFR